MRQHEGLVARILTANHRLILTYLIPCHLLTTHTLPTKTLLKPYPRLQVLFTPLATCIKRGDLAGYDKALVSGEAEFVKRRIYLTLERGRDIALRNLFRKVFLAGGYDPLKEGQTEAERIRRTRVPIAEFAAAMRLGMGPEGDRLEPEEVECLVANQIYKVSVSAQSNHLRAVWRSLLIPTLTSVPRRMAAWRASSLTHRNEPFFLSLSESWLPI